MLLHFAFALLFSNTTFNISITYCTNPSLADFRVMGVTYDGMKMYFMVSIASSYAVMEMATMSHAFKAVIRQ